MRFLSVSCMFVCFFALLLQGCKYDSEEELYSDDGFTCDTTNISFSEDIEPIIDNSCATTGCHVPGGDGNGVFTRFNELKEKVNNESLRQRVVVIQDMPKGPETLTTCQINQVEAWINIGAPNN